MFFRSADPELLGPWYDEHFGIHPPSDTRLWEQQAGPTVFTAFPADTDYFGRMDQSFMLNFRVDDLDGLLQELSTGGVKIDETREDSEYGRFAWVYDPEGNKIELWEPPKA